MTSTSSAAQESESRRVRQQVRVISILLAAERAGLTPVPSRFVHAIAYLADALAPVWDLAPITPEVLKRSRGPYDPHLQQDLDDLVGRTVLNAHDLSYELDTDGKWRVSADYSVRAGVAQPLIEAIQLFPDEIRVGRTLLEICLGLSALPPETVNRAISSDASYASRGVGLNSVLHLIDEEGESESARVVELFTRLSTQSKRVNLPQAVGLYLRHLYRVSTELSA